MSTEASEDQGSARAADGGWEVARKALDPFFDQLNAANMVVTGIAENLESEGIDSYAGPLRASSRNLGEAFHHLADSLKHRLQNGDSPSTEAKPEGPSVTYSGDRFRELVEAMAVAQGIIGLASDGEYFNTWDKNALNAAYGLLEPFTQELGAQAGIGGEEQSAITFRYLTAHSEGPEEAES